MPDIKKSCFSCYNVPMKRRAGILLHPTSLPSPYGIGDFGVAAYHFVDWLQKAGQRYWQILPLTIPDETGSPYASPSAMAGNWMLISPQILVCDNLLAAGDLPKKKPVGPINYSTIYKKRQALLKKSFEHFQAYGGQKQKNHFRNWQNKQKDWLNDYALFAAIKEYHHGRPWPRWPHDLVHRRSQAMHRWTKKLKKQITFHKYCQWAFFRQWYYLKTYANRRHIKIIGDVPFFVCHDSVDVWSHQDMFKLNQRHQPTFVSGVPPDYFSSRGQIWNDPHYDWHKLEQTGFAWWIKRFNQALILYDQIRLDHFRGYQAVWYIKRGSGTARHGRWETVPGQKLFQTLREKLKQLPFMAEDLGIITHEVTALRQQFGFPSTRILQFSFDGPPDNDHRPENYTADVVCYTGTHDNDTARGWIGHSGKPSERKNALRQTKTNPADFSWKLITIGHKSKANTFIAPLQDILNLGPEARLNKPGTKQKNWRWRFKEEILTDELAGKLRRLTLSMRR
jgi:4-alpha-glucanotransferase